MKKHYLSTLLLGLLIPFVAIAQQSPFQATSGGKVIKMQDGKTVLQKDASQLKTAASLQSSDAVIQNWTLRGGSQLQPLNKAKMSQRKSVVSPREEKWNAPGKLFLREYASLQENPMAKSSQKRQYLEDNFGLCRMGASMAKGQGDYVPVLLQFTAPSVVQEARALGFIPQTILSESCTGFFPLSAVEDIEAIEGVKKINVYDKMQLSNDLSRVASRVTEVQENYVSNGLSQSYDGTGVVVGIIDIGFDYTHPTFFANPDDENTYRVKRVWDQLASSGTAPSGYGYGTEYSSTADILAQEHDHYAGEHHGTHVAGIAAGSGAGTAYKGMAPGADIVLVSTDMYTTSILDGISYIQSYAESVGKPCVVNMSLASQIGPHTGTSAEDLAFSELSTPGNLLVGGAGNWGSDLIHVGSEIAANSSTNNYFLSIDNIDVPAVLDMYDYENGSFIQIGLGNVNTGMIEDYALYYMAEGLNESQQVLYYGDNPLLTIDGSLGEEEDFTQLYLQMQQHQALPDGYFLTVRLYSLWQGLSTHSHAWLQNATFSDSRYPDYPILSGDSDYTHTGSIASAEKVLSVAAYTSRSSWTDINGDGPYHFTAGETEDQICSFSSRGPLASSVSKPDIAAPGSAIISAGNSYSEIQAGLEVAETPRNGKNYPWMVMQGTSMSSPAMTGIVALMLQKDNDLDFYALKNLLQTTASKDYYVNQGGINRWGAGKVDALMALQKMENGSGYEDYYANVRGLSGFELKTALHELIDDHTVLTYSQVRDEMENIDARIDGTGVWDMYSSASSGWNWGATASSEGEGINREHSFPKSWFGGDETSPMYTDLFHLYPTDIHVNSMRGNMPFGEVYEPTWEGTISQVGSSASVGYNYEVFEPADEYKGDFARSYFYMVTRYEDLIAEWMTPVLDGSTDYGLGQWAIDLLLQWHEQDPVSEKEIARNEAIFGLQGNRNPFIDNPQWVEEIWGQPKPVVQTTDLMITEYVSGLRYGKPQRAIEIYNGSAQAIWLDGYSLRFETDGAGGFTNSLPLHGFVQPYSCFVVANDDSEDGKLLFADQYDQTLMRFNGNDAVALFRGEEMIDVVGEVGFSGNWGQDQVLRRYTSVTSPSTTYQAEQWLSFNYELTGDLGNHEGSNYNASTMVGMEPLTASTILVTYTKNLKDLWPGTSMEDFYLQTATADGGLMNRALSDYRINGNTLELILGWEMEPGETYTLYLGSLEDQWGLSTGTYASDPFVWEGNPYICRTIAELRAKEADGTTEYTLDGSAVVTAIGSQRNQKWIQDASGAGIMIDDPGNVITEYFSVGDNISGLKGTLTTYYGALQFTPTQNARNEYVGMSVSPMELLPEDGFDDARLKSLEGSLVTVNGCVFDQDHQGQEFVNGYSYMADCQGADVYVRVHIYNTDLTGSTIPSEEFKLTGLVVAYSNHYYISPRSLDDIAVKQVVPCDDLATLFLQDPDGYTEYAVSSEWNIVTAVDPEQNRFWIQDGESSIMVDYPEGLLGETYQIGDVLSGLQGTLRWDPGMMVYTLTREPVLTGETLDPAWIPVSVRETSLAQYPSAYVVCQDNLRFWETGVFEGDSVYTLLDYENYGFYMKLDIHGTDLVGQPIPTGPVNVGGIVVADDEGNYYLAPRSMADIKAAEKERVRVRLLYNSLEEIPVAQENLRVRMSFWDPLMSELSSQEYRTDKNGTFVFEAYAGVAFSGRVEATDNYFYNGLGLEPDVVQSGQEEFLMYLLTPTEVQDMERPEVAIEGANVRLTPGEVKMQANLNYAYSLTAGAWGLGSPIGLHYTPEDLAFMNFAEGDTLQTVSFETYVQNTSISYRLSLYADAYRSELLLDTTGVVEKSSESNFVTTDIAYNQPLDVNKDFWVVLEYYYSDGEFPYLFYSAPPFLGKNNLGILDREDPSYDFSWTEVGLNEYGFYPSLTFSHRGKLPLVYYYETYPQSADGSASGTRVQFSSDSSSVLYDYWQGLEPGEYYFVLEARNPNRDHFPLDTVHSEVLAKEEPVKEHILSIQQNAGGEVKVYISYPDIEIGSGNSYRHGSSFILEAVPEPGYRLVSWMDGRTEPLREMDLTDDITVSATFEEIPTYLLTIQSSTGGSVNAMDSETEEILQSGQRYTERYVTLTAVPDQGYMLKGWSFMDEPERSVLMYLNRDTVVYAEFVEQPVTVEYASVNLVQNQGGTLSVSCDGNPVADGAELPVGSTLELIAAADPTYAADTWWDGKAVTSTRRSMLLEDDVTLSVSFKRVEVVVDILSAKGGNIQVLHEGFSVVSGNTVPVGTELSLTALASDGYEFTEWWDGETAPERTLTVGEEDVEISATFTKIMYQLTIVESEEGKIEVVDYMKNIVYSDGDEVEPGTILSMLATANEGYFFVSWWDGSQENPRLFPVDGDLTISATFRAMNEYAITINQTEGGTVRVYEAATGSEVQSGAKYPEGTLFNMAAEPADNYVFVEWWDGDGSQNRYDFELTSDVDVSAEFVKEADPIETYIVTIEEPLNGSIVVMNGEQEVVSGESLPANTVLDLQAVAEPGYVFSQWWDGNANAERRISLTGDLTIKAEFVEEIPEYLLTIYQPEGGKISASLEGEDIPTGSYVPEGSVLDLKAEAETGYRFLEWWDGNTEAERTLEMTKNTIVRATFEKAEEPEPDLYVLTITQPENGTITVTMAGEVVESGAELEAGVELSLSAVADEGYKFVSWWDGNTEAERTYTMPAEAVTVSASFEAEEEPEPELYVLTITQPEHGEIMVTMAGEAVESGAELEAGAELSLSAVADEGYKFVSWWDGNTEAERTYTMPAEAVTVSATFKEDVANETAGMLAVTVYPNPSDGLFHVEVGSAMDAQVYTSAGRLLQTYEWEEAGKKEVDLQGRNSGTYYLRLIKGKQTEVIKLVIR